MAAIEYLSGDHAGQIYQIEKDSIILGRSESSDIQVSNAAVSRGHCEIFRSGAGYRLRDLNSRNKTLLNGRAIRSEEPLADRDEIRISKFRFRFLGQDSLREDSGTWGKRADIITIESGDEDSEADEEKSVRHEEVFPGQKISDSAMNHGPINGNRIVTRIDVADGSGAWPVIDQSPVKLNQVLLLMHTMRRRTTVDEILAGSLKHLFDVFPLAQNIAVTMSSDDADGIHIAAAVSRPDQAGEVQVALPVIRQAMQNREALLYQDHWKNRQAGDDDAGDDEAGALKSIMVSPLTSTSSFCSGAIQIDSTVDRKSFEPAELERLTILAHVISVLLDQARERDDRQRRDSGLMVMPSGADQEVEVESQVVSKGYRLEYARLSSRGDCNIALRHLALSNRQVALLLVDPADSTTSGADQSRLAVQLLEDAFSRRTCPAEVLAELQSQWKLRGIGPSGTSVCAVILAPDTGEMVCAMAGYFSAFQVRRQRVDPIPTQSIAGPPLGAHWPRFEKATWSLSPEDQLLICSNGVLGIMDEDGKVQTQEQFQMALQELIGGQEKSIANALCDLLKEYQASELLLDDLAFTMLSRTDRTGVEL